MPPCQEAGGRLIVAGAVRLPAGGGARGGGGGVRRGGAGAWAGAGVGVSVGTRVAGVVFLVLESALDDLALVATAGSLNALDVLVIRGQDGLQLLLEGVRLHFGVCIDHCALVLKCSCVDAVIENN